MVVWFRLRCRHLLTIHRRRNSPPPSLRASATSRTTDSISCSTRQGFISFGNTTTCPSPSSPISGRTTGRTLAHGRHRHKRSRRALADAYRPPPYLTEFRARFPTHGGPTKKASISLTQAIWPWTRMCSTGSCGTPSPAAYRNRQRRLDDGSGGSGGEQPGGRPPCRGDIDRSLPVPQIRKRISRARPS